MILYTYWMSSCSWRVRMALAWKRLEAERRPVDLTKEEQRRAEFATVSPQQQVPVLLDGDVSISQSMAILECLEEAYPARPLLPAEPGRRALVRQICEMIVSGIQ
ncbi:maleylacetoacetate isomerase-like, partial [Pollicipes pollicipes]|uniref:maleylacetoacetate isomerase-like n=1 Tax=Pollicipes pollicipes TaxID=41117 RepID=UPI001884C0AF